VCVIKSSADLSLVFFFLAIFVSVGVSVCAPTSLSRSCFLSAGEGGEVPNQVLSNQNLRQMAGNSSGWGWQAVGTFSFVKSAHPPEELALLYCLHMSILFQCIVALYCMCIICA
jgi:hypothetical protein